MGIQKQAGGKRIRRPAKKVSGSSQVTFGFSGDVGPRPGPAPGELRAVPLAQYLDPDPRDLSIGNTRLEAYLQDRGLDFVLELRREIRCLDLSALSKPNSGKGRRQVHPAIILALIAYGFVHKVTSLRGLERLARLDLGAMWLCGGVQPDHSTIGKFVAGLGELRAEGLYIQLTAGIIAKLGLENDDRSSDGTVVQAFASHYGALKAEAVVAAASEAAEAAAKEPANDALQQKARQAETAAEIATERIERNKANGNDKRYTVAVSPVEPESALQPLKSGARRFSYKPCITATKERLIVGLALQTTSEAAALEPMLRQHERLFGELPAGMLLDGLYHAGQTLSFLAEKGIDTLCPQSPNSPKSSERPEFGKDAFRYDPVSDTVLCPAGQVLRPVGEGRSPQGTAFTRYRNLGACKTCPHKARCAKKCSSRDYKRYEGDDLKEAMTRIMKHPDARARFSRRKVMVEPVFAEFRDRQGLTRFQRRGRAKVAVEFALHCFAYNVKRGIRLQRLAAAVVVVFVFVRRVGGAWSLAAVGVAFY